MIVAQACGSSDLPLPDFRRVAGQQIPVAQSNVAAAVVQNPGGGSAVSATDVLSIIVVVGLLSASSVAVNGFEGLRWFHLPDTGSHRGAPLSLPLYGAAAVAARSDVDVSLGTYLALDDGWLHDRALAPGADAVSRAVKLNNLAKAGGWPPTRSYVSGDGEVGLIWDDDRGYADVGFWSDGSLVYHVRTSEGEELSDDVNPAGDLPGSLLSVLKSFTS